VGGRGAHPGAEEGHQLRAGDGVAADAAADAFGDAGVVAVAGGAESLVERLGAAAGLAGGGAGVCAGAGRGGKAFVELRALRRRCGGAFARDRVADAGGFLALRFGVAGQRVAFGLVAGFGVAAALFAQRGFGAGVVLEFGAEGVAFVVGDRVDRR